MLNYITSKCYFHWWRVSCWQFAIVTLWVLQASSSDCSPIVCVTLDGNGAAYREVGRFWLFPSKRGFKFQWSWSTSSVKCLLDMLQIKIVFEGEESKSDVLMTCSVIQMCRELEEDVSRLKALAVGILNDMGGGGVTLPEDLVCEVCRFGAGEIHCVASIVGGIASQESIKVPTLHHPPFQTLCTLLSSNYKSFKSVQFLFCFVLFCADVTFSYIQYLLICTDQPFELCQLLTGQFTPIQGTFLYNAMSATSLVLNI